MTEPAPEWNPRSLSVVVPVYNEEENARPLVEGIVAAVRPMGLEFELVVVDDGSSDRTLEVLRSLVPETPELVVIALRRNFGQTLALQAGLDRARNDAIVTLDGDLQNDPTDIPRLLDELRHGADVVSGWRRERQDGFLLRLLPSWIANRLIRLVTGVPVHDQGCSLKAYRGDVIRQLDLYADMHRFIAILTMPVGAKLAEVEVRHHARTAGESKYGLSRTFKVIADLFTIKMITTFRERPLLWFALLGTPFLAASLLAAIGSMLAETSVVLATVTLTSAMTFVTCVLLGLLAESMIEAPGARRRALVYREWGGRS